MSLPVLAAVALAAAAPCPPHPDANHHVHATGEKAFVKKHKGGLRELVVRGVSQTALRREIGEQDGCEVDLEQAEQEFRAAPYELHAAMVGTTVLVKTYDYDPATQTLRVLGRRERGARARMVPRQQLDTTMLVFASTFVPFDSSF